MEPLETFYKINVWKDKASSRPLEIIVLRAKSKDHAARQAADKLKRANRFNADHKLVAQRLTRSQALRAVSDGATQWCSFNGPQET